MNKIFPYNHRRVTPDISIFAVIPVNLDVMDPIVHKKGKIYYSMGEVAEMFDVNQSLIRFWEKKFDVLQPHKNKKGNRMFTPADVDNLKLIYHLVKEKGMTLAGAEKRIKENPEGVKRDMEVVDRLLGIKAILAEIREELKITGDEVYAEEGPGFMDEEPVLVGKPTVDDDYKDADALIDLEAEKEWVDGRFDDLDELVQDLVELSRSGEISLTEDSIPFEFDSVEFQPVNVTDGLLFPADEACEQGSDGLADEEPPRPRIIEQTLF